MIRLDNIDEVKALQSNLRACLGGPPGQQVMKFFEQIGGWYDFTEEHPDKILIAHGKRQFLATIKTLLKATPEQIVALTQK